MSAGSENYPECTCFAGSNVFARHMHEPSCPCATNGYLPPPPPLSERERGMLDQLEVAWGIIANVSESDWSKQPAEWQAAAATWREKYHETLKVAGAASR